jgi:hypothetical protein
MTGSDHPEPPVPPPGDIPPAAAAPPAAGDGPPRRGPFGRWLDRHHHPANFWIHMLGIPLTIAAIPLAATGRGLWAILLFVLGYALQFTGHAIEGNRSGEELLLRRLLGKDNKPRD